MVHNLQALRLAILAVMVAAFCLNISVAQGSVKISGWTPIKDPKDPIIVEIGQFAITQHNKDEQSHLQFLEVVKGETLVVSGTYYKLVITAMDGNTSHQYEAIVLDNPLTKFRSLTSFKLLN